MRNATLAVARTIPQRLASGWVPPLMTLAYLMLGFQMLLVPSLASGHFRYASLGGSAFLAALLAYHLKQIILDSGARLLPGAPGRPLLTAVVVFGAYLIVTPLAIHAFRPAPLSSQTAFIWLVAAVAAEFVVRPRWVVGVVPAFLYLASPVGNLAFHVRVATIVETPWVTWSTIAISCLWLAAIGRRLAQMREESPGYERIGQRQSVWMRSAASTSDVTQAWSDPRKAKWLNFMAPADQRIRDAAQRGVSGNLWRRVARWRSINPRQYAQWGMLLLMSGAYFWVARGFTPSVAGQSYVSAVPLVILFGMAVAFTGMAYVQQWQYRSTEIVKPVTRAAYFREVGLSVAIDLFRNVGIVALMITAMTALFAGSLTALPLKPVLLMLLLLAAGTVFAYGCLVWFLRYRLMSVLGIFAPAALVPPLLLIAPINPSVIAAGSVAAGLGLAGAVLTSDAYRRWLRTDLG